MLKSNIYILLFLLCTSAALATDRPPKEDPDRNPSDVYEACHAGTTSMILSIGGVVAGLCNPAVGYVMEGANILFNINGMGKCKCVTRPGLVDSQGRYWPRNVCTKFAEFLCGMSAKCCWAQGSEGECKGGAVGGN